MESLVRDLRFALRMLRSNRGFTVVALLTLAVGLGVNSAMFSIVDGILLRPLPYRDEDRLVRLYQMNPAQNALEAPMSVPDFEDWRAQTRTFESMAAFQQLPLVLTSSDNVAEIQGAFVTDDFFTVLSVPAKTGRALSPDDIRRMNRVVVISDRLRTSWFGSSSSVVGRSVTLQGEQYTVVGVMPASYQFPSPDTDVWAPHSVLSEREIGSRTRDARSMEAVARLANDVTVEQARGDLTAVARRLAAEHPDTNTGWNAAAVVPLRTAITGNVSRALVILLGVVGFILLIACANLANLLLARGVSRTNEIAVRTALGASRMRIVRQLLTETVMLSLLGAVIGLICSVWVVKAVVLISANILPRVEDVHPDLRVITFGLVMAVITAVIFGLLPAWRAARDYPRSHLNTVRGTVGRRHALRSMLVIAEVAVAVVLVVGAGLLARSFLELRNVDPGFDPEQMLAVTIQVNVTAATNPIGLIHQRRREMVSRIGMLPGVRQVGAINSLPLQSKSWEVFEFTRADGSARSGAPLRADRSYVSSGYLAAMKIPLVRGEVFQPDWVPVRGAPTPIVISETAARRFWPGEDAVGRVVRSGGRDSIVVGIVGDVRHLELSEGPTATVYFPQIVAPRLVTTLVVRTAGAPMALVEPIRRVIHEIDPNQPIRSMTTMTSVLSESIARDRFFTALFVVFALVALGLAVTGVYGVLAYAIGERTNEIGVRMALGAGAVDVLRMLVGGGMFLVCVGLVIGAGSALMLTRVLSSQLYGVSARDPIAFIGGASVLVLAALVACYLPARRAIRIEPVTALRTS